MILDRLTNADRYARLHPLFPAAFAWLRQAKFTKLAAGCLDLHSKRSEVDFAWLAGVVAAIGGSPAHVAATAAATTALAALDLSQAAGLPLADAIASRARTTALAVTGPGIAVEVAVFDRHGRLVGANGVESAP